MDDEKKRRTRSSLNKKGNEIKKAKLTLKDENSNSKGSLSKNTKPKKKVQQKIPIPNDDVEDIDLKFISKGTNCVNLFAQFERGFCKSSALQQIAENSLAKDLRWFRIGQEYESCSRRVTAMQWHPSIPNVLVAGGKDGSITLFSSEEIQNELQLWRGIGPGGTVEDMQFHTKGSGSDVVTASIDGTLTLYNLDVKAKTVLVDTEASERSPEQGFKFAPKPYHAVRKDEKRILILTSFNKYVKK